MTLPRIRTPLDTQRVLYLPVWEIRPNPNQPRTSFSREGLEELSDSIREHGILQPLTVRRLSDRSFELVSGERRLRAAKLLHLDTVPCILIRVDELESSLLSLIENIQRRDLDFVEEALALEQLTTTYRLSQEQAAKKLGKSQSAVANKLRLLKLSPSILEALRSNGLTERHGRALLRLPEGQRPAALEQIIAFHLTVSKTEELVERLLLPAPAEPPPAPPRRKPVILVRDVSLFLNTLDRGLDVMKRSGIPVVCQRTDREGEIELCIRIPRGGTVSRETISV
jgi:ParB family chromosome partitioning protein